MNFRARPIVLAVLTLLRIGPLPARDLGVQGHVWAIAEPDLREMLIQSAARADWPGIEAHMRRSAQDFLSNLPRHETETVSRTITRWLDPSFVLDSDIRAPVQNADGEWAWSILYHKGTRFNPLTLAQPYTAMLFFDGRATDQTHFASDLHDHFPGKLILVEMSGTNPEPLAKILHTPVFTATEAMLARFSIQQTPTLLYPGGADHSLMLGLTAFAKPFTTSAVEEAWPQIADRHPVRTP